MTTTIPPYSPIDYGGILSYKMKEKGMMSSKNDLCERCEVVVLDPIYHTTCVFCIRQVCQDCGTEDEGEARCYDC